MVFLANYFTYFVKTGADFMSQSRPIRITTENSTRGTALERKGLENGDVPFCGCEAKNFQISFRLTCKN